MPTPTSSIPAAALATATTAVASAAAAAAATSAASTPLHLTVTPAPGAAVQPAVVANTSGTVKIQLVVYDNFNTPSAPAYATVTIQGAPGATLSLQPGTVGPGGTFTLTATTTTQGTISKYMYSVVG